MPKKKSSSTNSVGATEGREGNYVSEWFGQRIFPRIKADVASIPIFESAKCPFLTAVLDVQTKCIKREASLGVCTISTSSNGPRQDWLACPFRVISSEIVQKACEKIFGLSEARVPVPASVLRDEVELRRFRTGVTRDGVGYFFFQDKLGGEISVLGTDSSPEIAFDVTIAEVLKNGDEFIISRFGILEIQTMDFHGSYKAAVNNLQHALRLHKRKFASVLAENIEWAGEGIEGPNIANVFKRTFYQVLLKFELGGKSPCAGTVLAVPQSVWDSWQPFLGRPPVTVQASGAKFVGASKDMESWPNAHICIFDLRDDSRASVSPVEIKEFLRVSPPKMASFAFSKVPKSMLKSLKRGPGILETIKTRVGSFWPELGIRR